MKYQVRRHGNIFKLYEVSSGRYIAYSANKQKVKKVGDNLNRGGGFDGQIPSFMYGGLGKNGYHIGTKASYGQGDNLP
jgi:hypothetical protein